MGLTHGTIAGILLTDLIMGRENPWASLYEPTRKTLLCSRRVRAGRAQHGIAIHRVVDRQRSRFRHNEIQPESGAVLRRGLKKVAVYRDAKR